MLKLKIECYGNDHPKLIEDIKAALGDKVYKMIKIEGDNGHVSIDIGVHNESDTIIFCEEWTSDSPKRYITFP